jgi:predicted nucleic acid-binding protein
MVTFDTNVLVYATAALPAIKANRARDLIARGMRTGASVLLLQTLAEFSNVAIGKARIPNDLVRASVAGWCAVLPVRPPENDDLLAALDAVKAHHLQFWDAMLWACAERVGVRHVLTEGFQDGFELRGVRFVNPFKQDNHLLIDQILPP